jgi:gluconate 2-dehydrogenase gamma chain
VAPWAFIAQSSDPPMFNRRKFLAASAIRFASATSLTRASIICDRMPRSPFSSSAPDDVRFGPWQFFAADEASAVEADRIISPDPETPDGKDAGCAVFIDRQLMGPYGSDERLYVLGLSTRGTKEQSPITPAEPYRKGLAGLDKDCGANNGGKTFVQLSADQQDDVLTY